MVWTSFVQLHIYLVLHKPWVLHIVTGCRAVFTHAEDMCKLMNWVEYLHPHTRVWGSLDALGALCHQSLLTHSLAQVPSLLPRLLHILICVDSSCDWLSAAIKICELSLCWWIWWGVCPSATQVGGMLSVQTEATWHIFWQSTDAQHNFYFVVKLPWLYFYWFVSNNLSKSVCKLFIFVSNYNILKTSKLW